MTTFGSSVSLSRVTKDFGGTIAVDDVDFDIAAGEFVTLLGPSGSGKTTILKMLAGFEVPSSGSIRIGGREVSRLSPADRNIGMVFQHYALFPHFSVADNIEYGLKKRRWPRLERKRRVEEMLELIGLSDYGARRPQQLSGGQQQRVALARALATRPQLLLMDEPLGALDRSLRIGMSEEIKRLHRETQTTFLYVTHDQEEALVLSDRVAVMRDGRVQAADSPEELFQRPPNRFVAEFFANCNVLAPVSATRRSPNTLRIGFGGAETDLDTALDPNDLHGVAFHVDAARILAKEDHAETSEIEIEGIIREVLFMGLSYQCVLTLDGGPRVRVYIAGEHAAPLRPGQPVRLAVPSARLIALPK